MKLSLPAAEDYICFLNKSICMNCPYYTTDLKKGLLREHEYDYCQSLKKVLTSQHINIASPESCPILQAMQRKRDETDYVNRIFHDTNSFCDDDVYFFDKINAEREI